ncbi:hypothetical protein MKY59_22790 [Paenibacillus sp. FSL W8-0426]|uniref:hypothetical protein n=1 Tax=Paenibacillus sp. FSL W8-0426 TaxID=2921714 RepID=UPI0030D8A46D
MMKLKQVQLMLANDPLSFTFAEIVQKTPEQTVKHDDPILEDWWHILNQFEILNGGVVTVFGPRNASTIQSQVHEMTDFDGEWICIGKIEKYPLFINRFDGSISGLYGEPLEQSYVLETYGDINTFLLNYFMGRRYTELGLKFVESGQSKNTLGSTEDEWFRFLENHQLLF